MKGRFIGPEERIVKENRVSEFMLIISRM